MSLALWFAAEAFARIGVDDDAISRLAMNPPNASPRRRQFTQRWRVTSGPAYASPQRRYQYFDEGDFTFEEYAHRYMRYEWNAPLAEGIGLLRQQQIAAGLAKLESALPSSAAFGGGAIGPR